MTIDPYRAGRMRAGGTTMMITMTRWYLIVLAGVLIAVSSCTDQQEAAPAAAPESAEAVEEEEPVRQEEAATGSLAQNIEDASTEARIRKALVESSELRPFDLEADERRGHLWVATGSIAQYDNATPSNQGRTALLKLDLETGETLGEYRVAPDGRMHMLGALALASDGTVYAADSAAPLIYRLAPGDERPLPYAGAPMFVALRGIALSEDETKLYVSDYELGLFFFDLAEGGRPYALGVPPTLNLGGIDGLYNWEGHLVAIQNGVTPQRVLRLELDESGTRVANIATVAKALPAFDNPTFGTVAGDDLLFLGASHWHLVGPDGRPLERALPAVPVLRAAVDEAQSVIVGEEMLERLKRQAAGSGAG